MNFIGQPCSDTSESEDNYPLQNNLANSLIFLHPSATESCSDSEDSQKTVSDPEFDGQTSLFCGTQQFCEDIENISEEDIQETSPKDSLSAEKKRKQYTSIIRNLSGLRKRGAGVTFKRAIDRNQVERSKYSGCKCGKNCLLKFSVTQIVEQRSLTHRLKRNERKQHFLNDIRGNYDRASKQFRYFFLLEEVCSVAYGKLHYISKPTLCSVRQIALEDGKNVQPRKRRKASIEGSTVYQLMFRAWFNDWKNGRGQYMPDSPEFHLSPGLKIKDIAKAYEEERQLEPECAASKPTVYRWLKADFPEVKKRKFVRFTKCSICVILEDKVAKAGEDSRRKGACKPGVLAALKASTAATSAVVRV